MLFKGEGVFTFQSLFTVLGEYGSIYVKKLPKYFFWDKLQAWKRASLEGGVRKKSI